MPAISCVAFDFDGTLVDSNRIKEQTFYTVIAELPGAAAVMDRVLLHRPGDRFQIFRHFAEQWNAQRGNSAVTAESLIDAYSRHCEDAIASDIDFPGATRLLSELAERGIRTALISATPAAPLEAVIARKNWNGYFNWLIGGADDKAEGLRTVAERAGLPPSALAMVGDREVDRQGALQFGCTFIGVRRGDNNFCEVPELMADDLLEVLPLLDQAGGGANGR